MAESTPGDFFFDPAAAAQQYIDRFRSGAPPITFGPAPAGTPATPAYAPSPYQQPINPPAPAPAEPGGGGGGDGGGDGGGFSFDDMGAAGQIGQNRDLAIAAYNKLMGLPSANDFINTPGFKTLSNSLYQLQADQILRDAQNLLGYLPDLSHPPTLRLMLQNGVITPDEAVQLQTGQGPLAQAVGNRVSMTNEQINANPQLQGLIQSGALDAPTATKVGTVQQMFADRGGLRAISGPYAAASGEVLAEMQRQQAQARERANVDAYQMGLQGRGQDITATSNAGSLASGLPTTAALSLGAGQLGLGFQQLQLENQLAQQQFGLEQAALQAASNAQPSTLQQLGPSLVGAAGNLGLYGLSRMFGGGGSNAVPNYPTNTNPYPVNFNGGINTGGINFPTTVPQQYDYGTNTGSFGPQDYGSFSTG